MPRPKSLVPKLCVDTSRNRNFCKVDGKFVSLGPANSPEALAAYGQLLKDIAKHGVETAIAAVKRRQSVPVEPKPGVLLVDLFIRFATEGAPRYSAAEQRCIKSAAKIAREMFGKTAAAEFGPLRLRTVREEMIRKGWSRGFINKQVKRLRMMIRWGVGRELVPQPVSDSLKAVEPLRPGDSEAPESKDRRAISDADLKAVRTLLGERHRDIFDLMLLTGCRPGELLGLTTADIDRGNDDGVWRVSLAKHKTSHKGKSRTLYFNAKAQMILKRHLKAKPDARLFSLRVDTFSAAVKAACVKAKVSVFTPHWLRHTVATKIADEMGTEAAQRLLGHASKAMTEHYSKAAEKQAIAAVKKLA